MENTVQGIRAILQRNNAANDDDAYVAESEAKFAQILRDISLEVDGKDSIDTIKAFLSADEIQRRKVLIYCLDFYDPTIAAQQPNASGEQVQQHKFLQEDELLKLYKFVKRHAMDKSFGETVYQMIDKHSMTAPQVYKNAMLRRQDFSRVTDPKNRSVTRQIAWQIVVGLHCSIEEADEVLFSAGFIRRNSRLDLTMEYFIRHENYDIMAINEVLDEFGIKVFSCYKPVRDKDNK